MGWCSELLDTRKDDWNLTRDWGIIPSDGAPHEFVNAIRLNPFLPLSQVKMHMLEKYRETANYHLLRLHLIYNFLRENEDRLKHEGLISDANSGEWEIYHVLLQAFCSLRYNAKIGDGPYYTFDYQEVVETARRINDESRET